MSEILRWLPAIFYGFSMVLGLGWLLTDELRAARRRPTMHTRSLPAANDNFRSGRRHTAGSRWK